MAEPRGRGDVAPPHPLPRPRPQIPAGLTAGFIAGFLAAFALLLSVLAWPALAFAQVAVDRSTSSGPPADAPNSVTDITVIDGADVLFEQDVEGLINDTYALEFPEQVQAVRYLTFAQNDRNFNDTIENFLRANHPDWIQDNAFAPGELIIAVGFEPRRLGAYCGNDVCTAIDFYGDGRQDGILDEMTGPMQDDRIAIGLFQGAAASADLSVVSTGSGNERPWWDNELVAGAAAGGGVLALVGGFWFWLKSSHARTQAKSARNCFSRLQKSYGDTARNLDAINIRANSLTSPLADDALRAQWDDVQSEFLTLHDIFERLGPLTEKSSNRKFRDALMDLFQAERTVEQMETAQKNIDTLYDMEHGDDGIRRRELTRLRKDITRARLEVNEKGTALDEMMEDILDRIEALGVDDEGFMDTYTRLIDDYAETLEAVTSHTSMQRNVLARRPPSLSDSSWRPGTGYHSFIPYAMLHNWNEQELSRQARVANLPASSGSSYTHTSSTSTNTSFSSGFSGGGASRGW